MNAPCETALEAHALLEALDAADASGEGALLERLVPWLAAAGFESWREAGCDIRHADQDFIQVSLRSGLLAIDRSEHDRRRAILWMRWNHGGAAPWIEGQQVAVPRDAAGAPLTAEAGTWLGDDLYALRVQTEAQHRAARAPTQFSLLLIDARTLSTRIESPDAHETWTSPHLRAQGPGAWNLYADSAAREAGHVARLIRL
ncbi:hypothetical protein [Rhizobacter sp. LjRoot28]|uniref:hypothetical protein n=1 Tax=Rhizobacter sp. LjRoot28 TaxID=3342309 RepID=UPI003ED0EDFC